MTEQQIREAMSAYSGPSTAELQQDKFVLAVLGLNRPGWFVEFGTMDGRFASNTYCLENHYGWQGVVAEPGRRFHADLAQNRRCAIDHRAVAHTSGLTVTFQEVAAQPGLSTVIDFIDCDHHGGTRRNHAGDQYLVDTVSLLDLLQDHQAPATIDYISMDVEGGELAILQGFDFGRYGVKIWTIEHNYQQQARDAIHSIMTSNGYQRVLTDLSAYDDWYVHESLGVGK